MKKTFLLLGLMALTATGAMAQATLTVGSGDGSLSVTMQNTGWVDGDDATFDPVGAVGAADTIWNLCWWVYDVDGDVQHWADKAGFTNHTNKMTDGTVNSTATSLSNTGISFTGSPDLSADLSFTLAENSGSPLGTWDWTF